MKASFVFRLFVEKHRQFLRFVEEAKKKKNILNWWLKTRIFTLSSDCKQNGFFFSYIFVTNHLISKENIKRLKYCRCQLINSFLVFLDIKEELRNQNFSEYSDSLQNEVSGKNSVRKPKVELSFKLVTMNSLIGVISIKMIIFSSIWMNFKIWTGASFTRAKISLNATNRIGHGQSIWRFVKISKCEFDSGSKQTHASTYYTQIKPKLYNFTSIRGHLYARPKKNSLWQPNSYLCLPCQISCSWHTVHNPTVKYIYILWYISIRRSIMPALSIHQSIIKAFVKFWSKEENKHHILNILTRIFCKKHTCPQIQDNHIAHEVVRRKLA